MLKQITIILSLVVCCYCLESNDLLKEETRAKKRKRSIRLLAMILLFVVSKIAVFKVASFFVFVAFFQKLFYLGGLLISYFLKNPSSPIQPASTYGAPQEYNTVGYSYGLPDHEPVFQGTDASLPSIADFGGKFNWLLNKP